MERRRRRYLKAYKKSNLTAVFSENPSKLLKNYKLTLAKVGENVSEKKLESMRKIVKNLLDNNLGFLIEIKQNNDIIYSIFFGYNRNHYDPYAYAIFASGCPEKSNSMAGAAAYWESFCFLSRDLGISMVDLEGINSPKGGEFKLGFGGDIRPYFEVVL